MAEAQLVEVSSCQDAGLSVDIFVPLPVREKFLPEYRAHVSSDGFISVLGSEIYGLPSRRVALHEHFERVFGLHSGSINLQGDARDALVASSPTGRLALLWLGATTYCWPLAVFSSQFLTCPRQQLSFENWPRFGRRAEMYFKFWREHWPLLFPRLMQSLMWFSEATGLEEPWREIVYQCE